MEIRPRPRERMERLVQQMARPSRTSVRSASEDLRLGDICNVIRGFIPESRRSCVHSLDVRQERVGKTICNNSTYHLVHNLSDPEASSLKTATGHIFPPRCVADPVLQPVQLSMPRWSRQVSNRQRLERLGSPRDLAVEHHHP
jgi:hypothetical protein